MSMDCGNTNSREKVRMISRWISDSPLHRLWRCYGKLGVGPVPQFRSAKGVPIRFRRIVSDGRSMLSVHCEAAGRAGARECRP